MKKKIWFYHCIIEVVIIIVGLCCVIPRVVTPKVSNADLAEFVCQFDESNNYVPEVGYIPDAKTAAVVGGEIIENLAPGGGKIFGDVIVTYDAENRLWMVDKNYLFNRGGFVVIEQDTGRVIKALLNK